MRYEDLTGEQVQQIAEFEALCEAEYRATQPKTWEPQVGDKVIQGVTEATVVRVLGNGEVILRRPTTGKSRWKVWDWLASVETLRPVA